MSCSTNLCTCIYVFCIAAVFIQTILSYSVHKNTYTAQTKDYNCCNIRISCNAFKMVCGELVYKIFELIWFVLYPQNVKNVKIIIIFITFLYTYTCSAMFRVFRLKTNIKRRWMYPKMEHVLTEAISE